MTLATPTPATHGGSVDPKAYRLGGHVRPRHYAVHLNARLGEEAFSGTVAIQLEIDAPCDAIELHARDLQVPEGRLEGAGRTFPGSVTLDADRELAITRFGEPVPAGPATLHLTFSGKLNPRLEGLYLAADGPEQLLCTQCEATEARAIFPCFDEPTFKARFATTVTTAADATVLANAPLVSMEDGPEAGTRTWTFAPTRAMSSYLWAVVIGDVAGTPEEAVVGVPVRVWALRGKEHMGEFAHRYTARLLPWYEDYFGVPYHFDKYDQVAVPGFAAGAMENSGLVLFRQSALLMDGTTASWEEEKGIATVIAHEFAHMWFGNLVTLRWWDDLWLNEAFAEWVAHKAVSLLSPDYNIWDDFQRGKNSALATDALASTHPIYTQVDTPARAAELFDVITYAKGCAVLRMLEHYLGEAVFRDGLRTYMREFAESNAAGADLWRHLQQASREPITTLMESWIMQPGYPLLTVALAGEGAGTRLLLRQCRFYSDPTPPEAAGTEWMVPVVVRYEDGAGVHEARCLLAEPEGEVSLPVEGTLAWCYANAEEIGFYRQDPDRSLLDAILTHHRRLTPGEQFGLLSDQWALTRNATRTIGQFLDVLSALMDTDDYRVLARVVTALRNLEDLLEEAGDATALARFRVWVSEQFSARLVHLGFAPRPGESQNESQQRIHTVSAMCTLARHPAALAAAEDWASREAADPSSVDANLAPIFIAATAQFGDRARFDGYRAIYEARRAAGASPQETDRYLDSFVHFRDPALVAETLRLVNEQVLPQESIGPVLVGLVYQRHAQQAAWEYMKSHWTTLLSMGSMWTGILVEATGHLPAGSRADLVAFYDKHLDGMAQMSYARALEYMDQMAEFKARTRADLLAWFAALPAAAPAAG
ncbi:MAG TPA: M1 family aminopeptidase [Chloroflexia bacterium]|nr:M1 family aminopeptidase [Chloroflexia bacterium]